MQNFVIVFFRALVKLLYGLFLCKDITFGLHRLDRRIHKILAFNGLKKNGFFIEIGANDGVTQSNTLYLQFFQSWKGLLIEPLTSQYLTCYLLRSFLRKTISKNFLCSSYLSNSSIYSFVPSSLASSGLTSSLQLASNCDNSPLHNSASYTTLDLLCEQLSITNVDFISLDVEGHELEVLTGFSIGLNFTKWILVEVRNYNDISDFLSCHFFKVYCTLFETSSRKDVLFYNSRLVDAKFL